jgi:hypothetical protein
MVNLPTRLHQKQTLQGFRLGLELRLELELVVLVSNLEKSHQMVR